MEDKNFSCTIEEKKPQHHNFKNLTNEFNDIIDEFKSTFKITDNRQEMVTSLQEILNNPTVMKHITRSSDQIKFNKDGPINCSEQEIWLYKLLQYNFPKDGKHPLCWTYRGLIGNKQLSESIGSRNDDSSFYDNGTVNGCILLNSSMISNQVTVMRKSKNYCDVYETAHTLNKFDFINYLQNCNALKKIKIESPLGARVWLTPQDKDNHSTMFIHILNKERTRVLLSIFINSWEKKDYYNEISARFSNSGYYNYSLDKTASSNIKIEELQPKFPGLTLKIEDYTQSSGYPDKDLDITRGKLINASHNLQIEEGDNNCTLYAHNFCKAVNDMLKTPISEKIFELADNIDNLMRLKEDYNKETENLKSIFQNDLKHYLPQYYQLIAYFRIF